MSASDDRVLEWINSQKAQSEQIKQYYRDEWEDLIGAYMNYVRLEMPEGAEWVDDRLVTDAFRIVESTTAQQQSQKLRNPRPFFVEAPSSAGETYQWAVQSLLRRTTRNAHLYERQTPAVRMISVIGHGIQQTYWVREVGKKLRRIPRVTQNAFGEPIETFTVESVDDVLYDDAWVEWPDLGRMWKSSFVDRMGRHIWYLKEVDDDLDQMEAIHDQFKEVGGLYRESTMRKLKRTISVNPQTEGRRQSGMYNALDIAGFGEGGPFASRDLQDTISGISRVNRKGSRSVVRGEFWGYVPERVKRYDDTQWRLVELANGEAILRDIAMPTPDHRPPFDDIFALRVGDEPYGRSPLRWAIPEIEQRSILRNFRLAEGIANLFGTYAIDVDMIDPEEDHTYKYPGGQWLVRSRGAGVDKAVSLIPKHRPGPESFTEDALMEQHLLKVAGATDPFQGAFAPGGSHRTATEHSNVVNLGMNRHALTAQLVNAQMDQNFLTRAFELHKLFLETPVIVELAEDNNVRGEMDFRMLEHPVDIYIDTGEFGNLSAERLNILVQALGVLGSNPETAMAQRWDQVSKDFWYYAGFPRAFRYVKTPEEIQVEASQRQEAQLLQAAIGGSARSNGGRLSAA